MSGGLRRDEAFWRLVGALDSAGVLQHVMFIGTWAEWLYTDYFAATAQGGEYRVDIGKTHDIDVYFRSYLMEIEGASKLREELANAGFVPGSDFKGTFFYGGIEVEFVAGTVGVGRGIVEIPSVGIKAERLDELSMLEPAWVEKRGYRICVPTPASYAVQKLYINPERRPESKRARDMRKVAVLLQAMGEVPGQMDELAALLGRLPEDRLRRICGVARENGIALPTP